MEEVSLTELESRHYADLFSVCDVEKTGKIPMLKATEMFRSADISNEVVLEITSLAGIPNTAIHISRVQFYSCLKLIAAHQADLPLRQELIAATIHLSFPRFNWEPALTSTVATEHASGGLNVLPPPPPTDRRNSLQMRRNSQQQQHQLHDASNSDLQSTDSEVEPNVPSCDGTTGTGTGVGVIGITSSSSNIRDTHRRRTGAGVGSGSPEAWSTNSDSPTPTNSVVCGERPWVKDTLWQGLLGDEHRQLLGTEEESSDRHSSDDEDNENELVTLYQITAEQREYYYKQFKAVQRDPNGLLSGQAARVFFEKSRIPVEELRHIWMLCDVTRDGALSLSEFTAAMHLVVLRRNNIPLPTVLPACLHPNMIQHAVHVPSEPPEADLLHLNDDEVDDNSDNTIISANANNNSRSNSSSKPRPVPIEKHIMNISTISNTSQSSSHSRQNVTPPPVKNRSISNSPNIDKATTPPNQAVNLSAASGTVTVSSVSGGKHKQQQPPQKLWTNDAPSSQWTKFSESPTAIVSSPGLKPVNFDIKRTAQEVGSNPQILHPVPLRVTPVATAVNAVSTSADTVNDDNGSMRESSPKCAVSHTAQHFRDLQSSDLRPIQRPQAKKIPGKNIGALPPPPQRESVGGTVSGAAVAAAGGDATSFTPADSVAPTNSIHKKDPPPLPPPRPHRHTRSSSLDLNKFKMNSTSGANQPEIIAQASFDLQTSTGFADFSQFPEERCSATAAYVSGEVTVEQQQQQQQHSLPPAVLPLTRVTLQSNQRVSAFEVYRKPNTPRSSQSPPPTSTTTTTTALKQQQHYSQQPTQPPPPVPAPFGATGAAQLQQHAILNISSLPNADQFEKRVNAISETLRQVTFKQNENNNPDILRRLREQNNLLLRLCNDLSDELLTVQTRKEEIRLKLETNNSGSGGGAHDASLTVSANVTGGSSSSCLGGQTNV